MAMHKKLDVGSILFNYHDPQYNYYSHRHGREKYTIHFKTLYIHNRRERSNGVSVPRTLIPTLDKLGIRHQEISHAPDNVVAVGCRAYIYHSCESDMPYPTPNQVEEAREKLQSQMQNNTARNEGVDLTEIEFVQDFKEKKMSNQDAVFSLLKPLNDYLANETYMSY